MAFDFSCFEDFYLMHCFSEKKHCKEFNSGEKIYVNAVQYFHDLEDEFQRDFEGGIFNQSAGKKGFLLKANSNLTANQAIDKVKSHSLQDGEWIVPTSDFKIYINGYILCFTLIPKCYLKFTDKNIVFNKKYNIDEQLRYILNQYTKNSKCTFVSFYDAQLFMKSFCPQMASRGYKIHYGCVNYNNLSQEQKVEYYNKNEILKLVFTKGKKFEYQNEFRIFLQKESENDLDHIEETGINLQSSVVKDLVYLSPEYVNKLGWDKK